MKLRIFQKLENTQQNILLDFDVENCIILSTFILKSIMSTQNEKLKNLRRYQPGNGGKTVLHKIVAAIRALRVPNGSSRAAICKFLKSEFDYENNNAIKSALKKGVNEGILVQTGQRFSVEGDAPIVPVDDGPRLEIIDVKVGGGDRAADDGDTVIVKYKGKLESNLETFDSASSFEFVLGAGDVIKGWDRGIKGMRVGGKRKLVVPSKLGYGKRGCAPDIPPNATLLFDVQLKEIK